MMSPDHRHRQEGEAEREPERGRTARGNGLHPRTPEVCSKPAA